MAIEMVNRKINFLWNNGAGIQTITHNVSIEPALGGDLASQVSTQGIIHNTLLVSMRLLYLLQIYEIFKAFFPKEHMWYKITAERIANIGRLNVRKVKPIYDRPEYRKWVVGESNPGIFILILRLLGQ